MRWQRALHDLLCFPDHAPSSAFQGLVVLLAKVNVVSEPKQVRPIVLTEALTKLGARIATARVVGRLAQSTRNDGRQRWWSSGRSGVGGQAYVHA